MKRNKNKGSVSFSDKLSKLLKGVLFLLFLMIWRVWHLSVVQHEQKVEDSYKPQIRSIVEKANRATVTDRFGVPLAINTPQYNATLSYGAIRDLPARMWKKDAKGIKTKIFVRKSYIQCLAHLLARELNMDASYIEDLIHAKAAVLGNIPCLIKEGISDREYYRIKMLEKDWPGLKGEIAGRRYYPQGRTAGDIIGYVGPISRFEYDDVTRKLRGLRDCIAAWEEGEEMALPKGCINIDEVFCRLDELEKASYGINDLIGKAGIERIRDSSLRGIPLKKQYLIDRRGTLIRDLDSDSIKAPGKKLILSISTELQNFAENLLLDHEGTNSLRSADSIRKKNKMPPLFPWIKGGAIVALDPNTGEILALASSPRYDPNDFVSLKKNGALYEENTWSSVRKWMETEEHLAEIYDFRQFLVREKRNLLTGQNYDEYLELNLNNYLDLILCDGSPVKQFLKTYDTVGNAVFIQKKIKQLLSLFEDRNIKLSASVIFDGIFAQDGKHIPIAEICSLEEKKFFEKRYIEAISQITDIVTDLSPMFEKLESNYDKLLLIDLYRLIVCEERIADEVLAVISGMSLSQFRENEALFVSLRHVFKSILKEVFCEHHFSEWRRKEFDAYLAEYRSREIASGKKYCSPYTDCLEQKKDALFQAFWEKYEKDFILFLLTGCSIEESPDLIPYFETVSIWKRELDGGAHTALHWHSHYIRLKKYIAESNIENFTSYFNSFREFKDLNRPLLGKYHKSILANVPQIEKDLATFFYPSYGFGYLKSYALRQSTCIGSIFKLVSGYSVLAQRYLNLDEKDFNLNPLTIFDCKTGNLQEKRKHVGFFANGTPIPVFYRGGRLPKNDFFGRGSLDLVRALEMSSNPYFSLLVGDCLEDPEDLLHAAGLFGFGEKTGIDLPDEYTGYLPKDISYNRSGLYAMAIGQHSLVVTPLQTAGMISALINGGKVMRPRVAIGEECEGERKYFDEEIIRKIFLPKEIADLLKQGMHRVIMGEHGTARFVRQMFPDAFLSRIIGKTSTAEVVERVGLDFSSGVMTVKHVGFAAAGFKDQELQDPDIVVVVYLRYGEFGRDAAPMALKVIEKWESIRKKNNS